MKRPALPPISTTFSIEFESNRARHEQISEFFITSIRAGTLRPGNRIPSSRQLATDLGVSRQTVVSAYERLAAEGYIETLNGSGTFVPMSLPEEIMNATRNAKQPPLPYEEISSVLSERGKVVLNSLGLVPSRHLNAFPHLLKAGSPDFNEFPIEVWARLSERLWRSKPGRAELGYADPAGMVELREAIASYLSTVRGLACTADDIVVTSGSQQAMDLIARILLDPGDTVWMENPTYQWAYGAFEASGVRTSPILVDDEGINVVGDIEALPPARLVMVTPSRQYPTGVTMSMRRRIDLLRWAERSGAWIVEDDYDGEIRFSGKPLLPLRALAWPEAARQILYVGTFSKTLAPGLRIGFIVVPSGLGSAFVGARSLADRQPSGPDQAILAAFIREGHFATHLRRMRVLYAGRRDALLKGLEAHCSELLRWDPEPPESGLHIVARLAPALESIADEAVHREAYARGLQVNPLSSYWHRQAEVPPKRGLVIGFAYPGSAGMPYATLQLRKAILAASRS